MSNRAPQFPLAPRSLRFKRLMRRFYAQRYLQFFAIVGFLYMLLFNYLPLFGIQIEFKD